MFYQKCINLLANIYYTKIRNVKNQDGSEKWTLCFCMYSKHALEDQSEEEAELPSETTLIAEHERLAAEYHNERALLEEALRKSKDSSQNTSDDESTGEVECAAISTEKDEPLDKLQLRKAEPLRPIPTSKKKSDEDEVFALDLFAVILCDINTRA